MEQPPIAANDNTPRGERIVTLRLSVAEAAALFATCRRRLLYDLQGDPHPLLESAYLKVSEAWASER